MTLIRLGYAAMSMNVKNGSPSQTMTYTQFEKIKDREAAIRKLERIAASNLKNCLRLLRHNAAHDIHFFRLSSKLIPLANHPELPDWNFIDPLKEELSAIRAYLEKHPSMRVDFHPEHFVVLNTHNTEAFHMALKTLVMHKKLLKGMGIDPEHRCVLHVGGGYKDKEKALEQFIQNWGLIPEALQKMIMLENDDTTFTVKDTLYLCEKIGIPLVFDYHHYLANHEERESWEEEWQRVIHTWINAKLPLKMHISSPRSEKDFKAHADFIDEKELLKFLKEVSGSVPQIDIMIEAKRKDDALFSLMETLKEKEGIDIIDGSSFQIS
ncbi:UV DNA damage repair endonuclease UvsE [Pseudobacillus wudalianchiensis]|uniref:UV damage endonuclease UvsE n=1 Tax=Pseudobacillus wudalianchiensis TaxID=1743143 RepID=A0A1B9ATE3_9BACI|nr:UV DNA damage repair endonuclease UvsE [Bacillus wudalianchiensis]OCA87147.1 UV damage endonuclease UvsE [Bacillus wudalianchiensis]